jgi:hypothetical protein
MSKVNETYRHAAKLGTAWLPQVLSGLSLKKPRLAGLIVPHSSTQGDCDGGQMFGPSCRVRGWFPHCVDIHRTIGSGALPAAQ